MKHIVATWTTLLIPAVTAHPHNTTQTPTGEAVAIPDGTLTGGAVLFLITAALATYTYTRLNTTPQRRGERYLTNAHHHANNGRFREALNLYRAGIKYEHDKTTASTLYRKLQALKHLQRAEHSIAAKNADDIHHLLRTIKHHYSRVDDDAFRTHVRKRYRDVHNAVQDLHVKEIL